MNGPILGWDVGGANIKVARLDDGDELRVHERPFPLWRDPRSLPAVLEESARAVGMAPTMAVTMTAELADCFASKRDGVTWVIDALRQAFPDSCTWFYRNDGSFVTEDEARKRPNAVAAANWRASATFVARTHPDALFVDVGSTTTDVIPIVGGRIAARGRSDPARLRSGELVYTGLLRTPVCGIVRSVPLCGKRSRVAAEHFAIAADAHRWMNRIDDIDYRCDTPDGRGRSRSEAGARLARMVCADLDLLRDRDITAIAEHVTRAQIRQIAQAIRQVKRRLGPQSPAVAMLAGHGTFLARAAAESIGFSVRELASEIGHSAAAAAPAAAVALLLRLR